MKEHILPKDLSKAISKQFEDPLSPDYYDAEGWHFLFWDHRVNKEGREQILPGGPTEYGRRFIPLFSELENIFGRKVRELKLEKEELEKKTMGEGIISQSITKIKRLYQDLTGKVK